MVVTAIAVDRSYESKFLIIKKIIMSEAHTWLKLTVYSYKILKYLLKLKINLC
jgi:hypothetical protein